MRGADLITEMVGTRNQQPGTSRLEGRGFRALIAWQKADDLASAVYRALKRTDIDPWLKSQAIRASISVAANIAEANGRGSLGDYLRFLDTAKGSLSEVEYYIHFLIKEEII